MKKSLKNECLFDLVPRGYIGQEHLTGFNLINLNARIYDPLLGVFLSPDNYISDPTNVESYNRYGYCNNNPVRYTDPSGEFLPLLAIVAFQTLGQAWASHQSVFSGQTYLNFGENLMMAGIGMGLGAGSSSITSLPLGGLYGAGSGVLTNGISNILGGKYFFDNWEIAAGSGFIQGMMGASSNANNARMPDEINDNQTSKLEWDPNVGVKGQFVYKSDPVIVEGNTMTDVDVYKSLGPPKKIPNILKTNALEKGITAFGVGISFGTAIAKNNVVKEASYYKNALPKLFDVPNATINIARRSLYLFKGIGYITNAISLGNDIKNTIKEWNVNDAFTTRRNIANTIIDIGGFTPWGMPLSVVWNFGIGDYYLNNYEEIKNYSPGSIWKMK